uniref:Thymidine kinase n=1 Tax=Marseillevirus LCMAC102 TaxID=2506603 RepID=A0A481YTX6_9VIRU|nr:MAG: thymidine kinase [Marseillevirus LCMAC102]
MGTLDIISGPMFSGKSTMLLQKLIIEASIGFKVLYINHSKDTRSAEPYSTHNPLYKEKLCQMNNISLISVPYLSDIDISRYDVIGIDEAQFFDCNDLIDSVMKMVEKEHKHVIAAGLTGDFRRNKFGALLDLEHLSDTFTKLSSFCQICANNNPKCRTPALFTHRTIGVELVPSSVVDVGGCEKYIPVCRQCYMELNSKLKNEQIERDTKQ